MIQHNVALNTTFKNEPEKHATFRLRGKEKQLGKIADAQANDMIHMECVHRSVIAHFRFPCVENEGGLNNEDRKTSLLKDAMQETINIMETSEDHET